MKTVIRLMLLASMALGGASALAADEYIPRDVSSSLVQRGLFDLNPHINSDVSGLFRYLNIDFDINPHQRSNLRLKDTVDVKLNRLEQGELSTGIDVELTPGIGLRGPPHL